MRDAYHFSLYELGFVLGSMGLEVAASETIWGILTDKLGDKKNSDSRLMVISHSVCLNRHITYARGFACRCKDLHLGAALAVTGVLSGSINSSSGRTVMSWFDDNERGFAMSVRRTAIPVGGAISCIVH